MGSGRVQGTISSGEVVSFDEDRGWGTVEDGGGHQLWFHCTAVADGTRTIEVGTAVRYRVVAGNLGRWEATGLEPAHAPPA